MSVLRDKEQLGFKVLRKERTSAVAWGGLLCAYPIHGWVMRAPDLPPLMVFAQYSWARVFVGATDLIVRCRYVPAREQPVYILEGTALFRECSSDPSVPVRAWWRATGGFTMDWRMARTLVVEGGEALRPVCPPNGTAFADKVLCLE